MNRDEIVKILARSKLFKEVSVAALEETATITEIMHFKADTIIYEGGNRLEGCYLIASGSVLMFRKSAEELGYGYTKLVEGDSFREICLLTDEPTTMSIKTLEDTTLVFIPRESFEPILQKYTEVLHAVGRRIVYWNQQLISICDMEADLQSHGPKMTFFNLILILSISLVVAFIYNTANPGGISLFPKETLQSTISFVKPFAVFDKAKDEDILIIDAMPSGYFEKEHIRNAVSLPLTIFDFMYDMTLAEVEKTKTIVVYGRTISKHYDVEVANKLFLRGYKNVMILEGGLDAWKKGGYPISQ